MFKQRIERAKNKINKQLKKLHNVRILRIKILNEILSEEYFFPFKSLNFAKIQRRNQLVQVI